MATESRERAAVSEAYSGKIWQDKVKRMSDQQIAAIYLRLKKQNKVP